MSIEVIKPGMLTTFQDLGRAGYQHLGVPVNGAMDERSHRLANLLAGNASTEATLEVTLMGPTLRWHAPATIVICGADLQPSLDDKPIPMCQPVPVAAGAVLAFGRRRSGVRAYLAVHGGFGLTRVMGSASTYVRGGYGGLRGEPLRRGDVIALNGASLTLPRTGKGARAAVLPVLPPAVLGAPDAPLRAMAGREWAMFSAKAQRTLVGEPFRIDPQSDRMGYRLAGPALQLGAAREMISEAVGFGTVQVPPDGQPIVLMADRQTTGGYPRIAHVCAVDLPRLAQRMPGETVRFQLIDLAEAQRLMLLQEAAFAAAGEQ